MGQLKVYLGDDDLGTPRVSCMTCGQEGQLAQDQEYTLEELNNPDMMIACSNVCMSVKDLELSIRHRYEELLKG